MSIRVILKSGAEFVIKCDKFTLERDGAGDITSCEISGITENKPLDIKWSEVAAIVRVYSNENEHTDEVIT